MSDTAIEPSEETEKALAALGGGGYDDGLEDFDTSDMVMPRISIEHSEGVFVDNLTSEKHEEMEVVLLGLVKQRIMWSDDMDDGDGPLCKSVDAKYGNPREKFPWDKSGFDEDKVDGPLPCDSCKFSQWINNEPPPCSEQFTLPLMMDVDGDFIAPAITTFQRSGIKAVKKYLTAFKRSNVPLFTAKTKLSLDVRKKGSVTYSVPILTRVGDADPGNFQMFAENYRSIREYLHSADETPAEDSEAAAATTTDNSHNTDEDVPF